MLFTPFKLGSLTLRNRVIRAAAFEGMCPDNSPSDDLLEYHQSVAEGGVGMTTVAYASVSRSGLSFPHQLWLRKEAIPGLRKLTDAVHKQGAACSIQLGHCGNMAKSSVTGGRAIAPSARFNLSGPTFPKAMSKQDINQIVADFGSAVHLARECGFDAVEVHAGHGYLISQFLSPYTNRRKDEFGGSYENRIRFMRQVMQTVKENAGTTMPVLVKMNMQDGFNGGMQTAEALEVASELEQCGADALVLSGGFVSRSPMFILRGSMPVNVLAHYMAQTPVRRMVKQFGKLLMPAVPFRETYFLDDALRFRSRVRIPLVYVGGLVSRAGIEKVLNSGFELVAIARALIQDPAFINKLRQEELGRSDCDTCNYCIAVMYSGKTACIQHLPADDAVRQMLPAIQQHV